MKLRARWSMQILYSYRANIQLYLRIPFFFRNTENSGKKLISHRKSTSEVITLKELKHYSEQVSFTQVKHCHSHMLVNSDYK